MASSLSFLAHEGETFRFSGCERFSDVQVCLSALGISKTLSARLRAQGRASIDPATAELVIRASAKSAGLCAPLPNPLRVLYEDDFILAADKPAGLLVHSDGSAQDTLSARVEAYLAATEGVLSPQAVQRLDVDTTGVVLFSKAAEFQGLFDALVADHALMRKRYLALVEGAYPKAHDCIDVPLARDRHDARRMRTCPRGQGQDSLTYVERLAIVPGGRRSLLLVTLGTGRKHQIRVHLASRGYPIVGDTLYGLYQQVAGEPLMLHAWQESFVHPITGQDVRVISPGIERFEPFLPGTGEVVASVHA